jgi:dTDP-4-dehydrorhamnose reductase
LLSLFKKHTNHNIQINKIEGRNTDKSFIDTRGEINYSIPSYEIMIKDMMNKLLKDSLYHQYNKVK